MSNNGDLPPITGVRLVKSALVSNHKGTDMFTCYAIEVSDVDNNVWRVFRRFREFKDASTQIKTSHGACPELKAPRRFFRSQKVLKERFQHLQEWLTECFDVDEVR